MTSTPTSSTHSSVRSAGVPPRLTEHDLRTAYRQDQLELFFQPILELATGQLRALEALVRWRHPDRGLLLPHRFLGLASSELALELNRWVLLEAGEKLARKQDSLDQAGNQTGDQAGEQTGTYRLTVNLFSGDFIGDFLDELPQLREMSGWPLERLELDFQDRPGSGWLYELGGLSRWGVRVALNGQKQWQAFQQVRTHLPDLPIESWKIEPSTLQRLAEGPARWEQLEGTVRKARYQGLRVVAKGVLSLRQAARLHEIGCQDVQGFCFSYPTTLDKLSSWLKAGASAFEVGE